MAKGGIPVVLVTNGAPAILTNRGMPITIVGGDAGSVVQDGESVTLSLSDDTGNLATVTANIVDGALANVALPSNKAVLTDQQASVDINQFDSSGSFAATVGVANNEPNFTLANATTRIIVNAGPCQVSDAAGKTVGAVFGVDQGALEPVQLTASGDAIVSTGQALTGVAPTGTYTNTVTFTVANGVITGIALS